MLPFFSSNIKDNLDVIHFHINSRGLQDHVFVQITFENCTLNFYFENGEIVIKKQSSNCSPYQHETSLHVYAATFLISSTKRIFTKLLSFSESSIKIKVRSHWAHFLILLTSAVICKQCLCGNEIVQYLQNCKCYNVDQDHFRNPL